MLSFCVRAISIAALLVLFVSNAHAGLVGDEVFGCVRDTGLGCATSNRFAADTAVVTAAVEFGGVFGSPDTFRAANANFDGDSLNLFFQARDPGHGALHWSFSDLDWLPTPGEIVDVVDLGTAIGELLPLTSLSFGPDSIDIVTGPIDTSVSHFRRFQIVAEHRRPIPEPGSATLFGIGSLLIGATLRRRG